MIAIFEFVFTFVEMHSILRNLNIEFDSLQKIVPLTVPPTPTTNVTGTCATNDTDASLTLSFMENEAKRMVTFGFVNKNQKISMKNVKVAVELDNSTFPNHINSESCAVGHF